MTNSTISDMDAGFAHVDLTGKLIIKAQFGNDIRKIPIHNVEITYNELVLMMERLFKGKINSSDEVLIKYRDEDGDLVTIADDSDLKFAVQCSCILKLSLYVVGKETGSEREVETFKTDLQKLMEKANTLLEKIDNKLQSNETKSSNSDSLANALKNEANIENQNTLGNAGDSKEFDPLSKSNESKTEVKPVQSFNNDNNSIKGLESMSLNDRQPATIQPSFQKFQTTQNIQQKQGQYQNQLTGQTGPSTASIPQPPFSNNTSRPQQQPLPYRYGITTAEPPHSKYADSRNFYNSAVNGPPSASGSTYPTPSSTPASFYSQPVMSGPPMSGPPMSGPPMSGPPMSGPPMSGLPMSASSMSAPPTSAPSMSCAPIPNPSIAGPPVSGPPTSDPSIPCLPSMGNRQILSGPQMSNSGPNLQSPTTPSSSQTPGQPLASGSFSVPQPNFNHIQNSNLQQIPGHGQNFNQPPNANVPPQMPLPSQLMSGNMQQSNQLDQSQSGQMPSQSNAPLAPPSGGLIAPPPSGPLPGSGPRQNPYNRTGPRSYIYPQTQYN